MMGLEEARKVIRDDAAQWAAWVEAAGVLSDSRESSLEDLIQCLKRNGLPAETAACALYVRTERPRADSTIQSVVLDHRDWSEYLIAKGLM